MNFRQHFPFRYPDGGTGSSAFSNHQTGFIFWQVLNFWDSRGTWRKIFGGRLVGDSFEADGSSVFPDSANADTQAARTSKPISFSFDVVDGMHGGAARTPRPTFASNWRKVGIVHEII
jgi:hypothetical protein